jgi:hydroxysqualene synthase
MPTDPFIDNLNNEIAINPALHYENFPVGSWLVPKRKRPVIHAIYRFARFADDIADEGNQTAQQRIAALESLKLGLEGNSSASAFFKACTEAFEPKQADLAHAIIADIEKQVYPNSVHQQQNEYKKYLTALIDAFIQDSKNSASDGKPANPMFQDQAGLLHYCERSANPVGRMMLLLFDCHNIELLNHSDAICTGLQWINFMQDVSVDQQKGRIYCPADAYNFQRGAGGGGLPSAEVILSQTHKARAMLVSGKPLLQAVPLRLSLELRAILAGGMALADKIIAVNGATQNFRPTLTKSDALGLCKRFFWLR